MTEDKGHDEPVEPQGLPKDENKDHAYVQPRLLSNGSHARIAYHPNRQPSRKGGQAARQARGKVRKAREGGVRVEGRRGGVGRSDWQHRKKRGGGGRQVRRVCARERECPAARIKKKKKKKGGPGKRRGAGGLRRCMDALLPTRIAATISP